MSRSYLNEQFRICGLIWSRSSAFFFNIPSWLHYIWTGALTGRLTRIGQSFFTSRCVFSSTDDSILLTIYLYIQLPACVQKAASRGAETVLPMAKRPVDTFGPNASRMHALQPVRGAESRPAYMPPPAAGETRGRLRRYAGFHSTTSSWRTPFVRGRGVGWGQPWYGALEQQGYFFTN